VESLHTLEKFMMKNQLNPFLPFKGIITQEWDGPRFAPFSLLLPPSHSLSVPFRFVEEGLSVQVGDLVMVVEVDLFRGWLRCVPLGDGVHFRHSGWLPSSLLVPSSSLQSKASKDT